MQFTDLQLPQQLVDSAGNAKVSITCHIHMQKVSGFVSEQHRLTFNSALQSKAPRQVAY